MRKFICLLLVAVMLTPCALAETVDYSKLSPSELNAVLNAVRNEITRRGNHISANRYLYQDDDLEIYYTGSGKSGDKYFELEVVVVNKSNITLSISFDSICINGWEVSTLGSSISGTNPGKRKKDYIRLTFSEAECESFKDMQEIEFIFHTYDENYRTVKKYGPVLFIFKGQDWS